MFFRYRWRLTTEPQDLAEIDKKIAEIDNCIRSSNNRLYFMEERKELLEFKLLITSIYDLHHQLSEALNHYETTPNPDTHARVTRIAKELDLAFQAFMARPIRERMLLSAVALFTIGLIVLSILYSYAHLTKDEQLLAAGVALAPSCISFLGGVCTAKTIAQFCFQPAQNAVRASTEKVPVISETTFNPVYANGNAVFKIFDMARQYIQVNTANEVKTGHQYHV